MVNLKKNLPEITEQRHWLLHEIGFVPVETETGIRFYYDAMHDHDFGLGDADDYAWLNTLLGYDIGAENAKQIIRWCYEEVDSTVYGTITFDDKGTLKNICEFELDIKLDFSHWAAVEPEVFDLHYGE